MVLKSSAEIAFRIKGLRIMFFSTGERLAVGRRNSSSANLQRWNSVGGDSSAKRAANPIRNGAVEYTMERFINRVLESQDENPHSQASELRWSLEILAGSRMAEKGNEAFRKERVVSTTEEGS